MVLFKQYEHQVEMEIGNINDLMFDEKEDHQEASNNNNNKK